MRREVCFKLLLLLSCSVGVGAAFDIDVSNRECDQIFTDTHLSAQAKINFYTSHSTTDSSIVFTGNGHSLYFPRIPDASNTLGVSGYIKLDAYVTVTMIDVVFHNFDPDLISLDANAQLYFGNGVVIELAHDQMLDGSFSLIFVHTDGSCTGTTFNSSSDVSSALIQGHNNVLNFTGADAITVDSDFTLSFQNITLAELNGTEIACVDSTGEIDLLSVVLEVKDKYAIDYGTVNVVRDSVIKTRKPGIFGCTNDVASANTTGIFSFGSTGEFVIEHSATLFVDQGVTLSWDAMGGPQNLVIEGCLHLNGCQLYATTTGLELRSESDDSRLVFEEQVQLTSDADGDTPNQAIKIDDALQVEFLGACQVDVCGALVYESL